MAFLLFLLVDQFINWSTEQPINLNYIMLNPR